MPVALTCRFGCCFALFKPAPQAKNWWILLEQTFMHLHALADSSQCVWIMEKTLEFSSTALPAPILYSSNDHPFNPLV